MNNHEKTNPTSSTHTVEGKGCSNWISSVPIIASEYPTIRKNLIVEKMTTIAPTQIQNIDAGDEKPKPKRICREITITVQEGEYIELTFMGRLRRETRELWANDTLKICKDI